MSYETWIMVFGFAMAHLVTLVCGLIHITTRLARIETDISWLKKNGSKCQPNLENLLE